MSKAGKPVSVTILGKEYRIACEEAEVDALLRAARHLDARMREIRTSGKVIGSDRIAVMAALNLSHELLSQQTAQDTAVNSAGKRVRSLRERIEIALNDSAQLEL